MKQSSIIIIALFIFLGCTKKDTTPNTNNITNTTVVNAKWIKIKAQITYAPDGVTESARSEFAYDSEGRQTEYAYYSNGVILYKSRDYTYIGDECVYYTDMYTSGSLSSTTKYKIIYKNN